MLLQVKDAILSKVLFSLEIRDQNNNYYYTSHYTLQKLLRWNIKCKRVHGIYTIKRNVNPLNTLWPIFCMIKESTVILLCWWWILMLSCCSCYFLYLNLAFFFCNILVDLYLSYCRWKWL